MDLNEKLDRQRLFFQSGATRGLPFRREQLTRLQGALASYEDRLLEALHTDLGKARFEGYATELSIVKEEIEYALRNLKGWMKPKRTGMPISQFPSRGVITPEPKGVVLIFSPWNYPLQLALAPLVAAMAAGNCAVLKPSRHSAATSRVLIELLDSCFAPEYILPVEGNDDANDTLLSLKFDHIFFTGSPRVGRVVMAAAAAHLTPVTLELGGKSPCIVDPSADIETAARRIAWGKAINAGQTCVAPDYLLVHSSVREKLCKCIAKCWEEFYGCNPLESPDLPHIISDRHYLRLKSMLDDGTLLYGGTYDDASLRIAPSLIAGISPESALLTEEIFGPILPVLSFDSVHEAIARVRRHPTPLALYLFTKDSAAERRILEELPFGGGCINDTVIHLCNPALPFGGVGESGLGAYHGRWGFDTLSHHKSVVKKSSRIDIRLRYPPYGDKLKFIKRFIP